jgi:hypothetical protein
VLDYQKFIKRRFQNTQISDIARRVLDVGFDQALAAVSAGTDPGEVRKETALSLDGYIAAKCRNL